MLFDNRETRLAIETIKKGAEGWTANELAVTLRLCRQRKDPRLDEVSRDMQKRYLGLQKGVIEDKLKKQFPKTENMPIAGINWMKLVSRLDAGIYVSPPDRFLVDENNKRIPADSDPRGALWSSMLERAKLNAKMAEAERRVLLPPGNVLLQFVWIKKPGDPIGIPRIDLYYPHDVECLCHWAAPTSWEFKYIVAMRQASPDPLSQGEWWRVWSRVPPVDLYGDEPWGPWSSVLISTKGEQATPTAIPIEYPGKELPIALVRLSEPEGFTFVLEDSDLIDIVDDLNMRRSNESFVIGLQGHDQMWTDDQQKLIKTMKGGPDTVWPIAPGSLMGMLSPNPKLSDMRESRKLATRELAIARGNSADAYATEPGPPVSGVAKRIWNTTHDIRVAEQAGVMHMLEQEEVLPILLDVIATYHPQGAALRGLTPKMTPRQTPLVEDPAQKQLRIVQAVQLGWITPERGAADLEYYPSVAEAAAAMASIPKPAAPAIAPAPPAAADGKSDTTAEGDPVNDDAPSSDEGEIVDGEPEGTDDQVAPPPLPKRKVPKPDAPSASPSPIQPRGIVAGVPVFANLVVDSKDEK